LTLDDLDQAIDAPDDLVARAERLTLDEVQRDATPARGQAGS
jgi:hypothetical protein